MKYGVVVEPPQRSGRKEKKFPALVAQALEVSDSSVRIAEVMPCICSVARLRKMPSVPFAKVKERVVAPTDDENPRLRWKKFVDRFPNSINETLVMSRWRPKSRHLDTGRREISEQAATRCPCNLGNATEEQLP